MTTYIYRDARRERLSAALAVLPADDEGLRPVLEMEQAALQTDDWTVTDRTYHTVAADWIWQRGADLSLKPMVDSDPALLALGEVPALTDFQAQEIQNMVAMPGAPHADYLGRVREVIGDDEAVFTELLHAGHHHWIALRPADRPYPYEDVGVLLPLRLETLFDPPDTENNPDPARWQLLLRVTPDEASIRRDDPFISQGEQEALLAFWEAVRPPGWDPGFGFVDEHGAPIPWLVDETDVWLNGDAAGIAWQQLSDRVRPERAAWLVGEIDVLTDGVALLLMLPDDMPIAPRPNRAGGLPPELHVYAATSVSVGGEFQHKIGRLPLDENAQINNEALELRLPETPDESRDAWWTSWEKAKEVGLGGEWLLPEGMAPDTLLALYVVGIGDETPEAHFRAQVNAGELSILRLGTPTNTAGGAATDSAGSAVWRDVARERLSRRTAFPSIPLPAVAGKLQRYLLGPDGRLPFFPGAGQADETEDSRLMAAALWPALWGHWLRDLWQTGDDAYRVGLWMAENLFPEGPLPPLRIDDQPYGLLPVTALSRWVAEPFFDPDANRQAEVESRMADALIKMREQWVTAVTPRNSVVGKSSAQFIELLGREALSRAYLERRFIPAWVLPELNGWDNDRRRDFNFTVERAYEVGLDMFGMLPDTLYLANSYPRPVRLPLVQPNHMPTRENGERLPLAEFLQFLYDWGPFGDPISYDLAIMFQEHVLSGLPDSLFLRLLFHAVQLTVFWHEAPSGSHAERRLWDIQQTAAFDIAAMFDDEAWLSERPNPFQPNPLHPRHHIPALAIPEDRLRQLERAFRATLDSAAHRIDPLITGFAWQRLRRNTNDWRGAHRLGAYGWLDGPFLGRPGPTDAGRLHTPSYNQTLAALVLRDKFLSSGRAGLVNESGDNPWQMDITSGKARLAEELAEEVRMGFEIHEILGRHVENIIGDHQTIKELRTSDAYAMFPERKDPNEVCNGQAALRGLLAGDPAFPLTEERRRALRHLAEALDTYGDLLMADGVMQLVNREIDRAAATMDAAAGFTRPPGFDFLHTPPSGYQLESIVVSALPFVDVNDLDPSATPGRLADPSVAAFLEARLGMDWTWTADNADDGSALGSVTLPDLGLTPIDALALSDEFLGDLARRKLGLPLVFINDADNRLWSVTDVDGNPLGHVSLVQLNILPDDVPDIDTATLHDLVREALGGPPDGVVEEIVPDDPRLWLAKDEFGNLLGMAAPGSPGLGADEIASAEAGGELQKIIRRALDLPPARITTPSEYVTAGQLVAVLGSRPAAGRDLVENPTSPLAADPAARAALETAIYGDLRARYERLYAAADQMIIDLTDPDIDPAATLRRALTWGLVPATEPADRESLLAALLGHVPPAGATELATLARKAAEELTERRKAAPDLAVLPKVEDIGLPQPDNAPAFLPDGVSSLARVIANLASPDGLLAVLARWPRDEIVTSIMLDTTAVAPGLDETWLTVVAAPRAALARLEALQLEMEPPLAAWSSSPQDPWQTEQVAGNTALRRNGITEIEMPRFAAAYGPADVWDGAAVAVGLIDAFSEAIPMAERSTMSAFGFNAPAARAPQAILLAVPPASRLRLDEDLLCLIVQETRDLARARTARVEDLGAQQALVPTMWLRANGPLRARLRHHELR